MSFKVEKLENEPIILISLLHPHTADEIPLIHQETVQLAANMQGKIFRVVDFTHSGLNFSQVVFALQEGTKKREGGVKDERFHSIYIANNAMAKLLVDSLKQEQYGSIQVDVFGSVDEAMAFAREKMS